MPRKPRLDLSTATVLVTGAGRGIGRATALAVAGRGATVLAADLDGDTAAATAAEVGGKAYRVDVADRESVAAMAAEITAGGVPDVIVNNAGVGMTGRFIDMSAEDWDWIIGVNLRGALNVTAALGPAMLARGRGHVVNVSSGLAYTPRPTEPGYVTTKAALLAFSQCLRADWHDAGIGVSVVCPGVIATGIVASNTRYRGERDDPAVKARLERTFSRGHRPELVAAAIVDAVERDRSVVPVGFEARLGWAARRVIPQRVADRLARLGGGAL